jgi:signal transduction histidine kinase
MPTVIRLNQDSPPGKNLDFSGLFDAIPEPIAYFGPDRKLTACNRRFRELFPVVVEERLQQYLPREAGSAFASALVANDAAMAPSPYPDIMVGGKRLQPHTRLLANGGMLVNFEDVVPPPELELRHQRIIDELHDRLEIAQDASRAAEDRAENRKNALVAASHEMRTPLNAILGFSEMLESEMFGPLGSERYREYVAVIRESGKYLLNLINDTLDLARVDAGKTDLNLVRVEVLKVILDCVKTMEPLAARSRVGFSVHIYDGVSEIVGDDMRLHQMLLNLLSNAVKFTQAGSEISIEVFRRGRFAALSVSDSGGGLSAEDMARVLKPFEQTDAGRKARGTGLGLPLTRELALLHGGEMKMESAVDAGTTITILLPIDGPGQTAVIEAPATQKPSEGVADPSASL